MRYQYALPLSVQYDSRVPSASESRAARATPDAARSRRAQRAKQSRAPSPAMIASSVAKPGGDLVDVAVPTGAQARRRPAPCPPGTPMTCSWNACSGASNSVRPSGATSPSGITTAGRNGSSRQRDIAASLNTGNANSVY